MSLIMATLRGLLLAAGFTLLTMIDIGVPNEDYWDDKRYLTYVALGVAFLSYMSGGLTARLVRKREAAAAHKYQSNVQAALAATLVEVTEKTTATWKEVGVHAFRVRGFWPNRRLVNVGGVRLSAKPSMDRPIWTYGKGVVGQAWKQKSIQIVDWQEYYSASYAMSKKAWERQEDGQRYKMSWQELMHSGGYRSIIAFPIVDLSSDAILGCVSIDAPLTKQEREGASMETTIRRLAEAVGKAGDPPTYWFQQRV